MFLPKAYSGCGFSQAVSADFARQLERELHETQGVVMALQLRCKEWREVALKLSAAAKQVAYNLAAKPDYNELNFALTAVERMKGETK